MSLVSENLNKGKSLQLYDQTNEFNWREFACGWGAAVINITVTYPINKIIFRQMLHGIKAHSAFLQLRGEGVFYLYRGMLPPLCQKSLSVSLMFGVYEEVRRPLVLMGYNAYAGKIIGAMVAGTTEAILMPFERVQTLLADSRFHTDYKNTFHAFKVLKNFGLGEYYRGAIPILLRNGPSNIGFFLLRDELQCKIPKSDTEVFRTLTEFLCGAVIGVVLSSIFYPLNVVKVKMQCKVGGEYENVLKVLMNVYKERGSKIKNIYRGVHTNCTRAFLSWGVMNTAYEHIKTLIY